MHDSGGGDKPQRIASGYGQGGAAGCGPAKTPDIVAVDVGDAAIVPGVGDFGPADGLPVGGLGLAVDDEAGEFV
jgi:hypothetical protein